MDQLDPHRQTGLRRLRVRGTPIEVPVLGLAAAHAARTRRPGCGVRRHTHRWRSLEPETGAVTAEGTAPTFIMRRALAG